MVKISDILWFKEIDRNALNLVGGKGLNLGLMYARSFPVPPGFVVTTEAYKRFLKETNIEEKVYSTLENLDVEDADALYNAAEKVQTLILNAKMPPSIRAQILEAYENLNVDLEVLRRASKQALDIIKAGRDKSFVAIRSSATAEDLGEFSFAGQQASFLNVKGDEDVITSVQKCWASLFTSRAVYYRVKNKFDHRNVFIAVVCQKMINSEKSGVVFTKNPSTGENEIIIEAVLGLGETIVSGSVTPDHYVVNPETMQIKVKKIEKQSFKLIRESNLGKNIKKNLGEEGSEQKLTNAEIIKLADICREIEEYYRKPQDIEFAVESGRIYIVQSRPVTTINKGKPLSTQKKEEDKIQEEIKEEKNKEVLLEGFGASPHIGFGKVKIIHGADELNKIETGDILVTEMTSPDFVPGMKRAVGIITDAGGSTSHAAIVSRELEIACVVGTEKATNILKDGDEVTVDGINGKVYAGILKLEEPKEEKFEISEDIDTVTKVKVNLDMPNMAKEASETNADGIGLLRAEFLLSRTKEHPGWMIRNGRKEQLINELVSGISEIAKYFKGKPIWYRTSDIRTDEYKDLQGGNEEPKEDNPMMGWHGIRRSLDEVEFLRAEFEAIKKVHDQGFTNVGVMLPMVISVEEVRKAKELLNEIGLEPLEEIEFGVMVETPAAVQTIDEICKEGVDFISFGSNDLTQFTLGIDRNNAKLQHLWSEMHPAVLREINHVIKVCRENNVETSICGQAGSNPEMVEFLVKKGIDSISANIDAVSKIKRKVWECEKKLLLTVAREKLGN